MIPNKAHFIFGMDESYGGMPFSALHYAAIRSAKEMNKCDQVMVHVGKEPDTLWWKKALDLGIQAIPTEIPQEIFGKPLLHYAHRADVIRLKALIEHGGTYLDVDVITIRDFAPLRDAQCVMGLEHGNTLCNGVIMAEADAEFCKIWLEEFHYFRSQGRDHLYAEHACRVPARLAAKNPDLISVEPEKSFHWPDYTSDGIKMLFGPGDVDYGNDAYAHHLWASVSRRYHTDVDLVALAERGESYFARLLRPWILD